MGQARLLARLAARDLRNRPTEAVLLLLVIVTAATILTVGLTVRDLVRDPYQSTREATSGPDVVAFVGPPPENPPDQASGQPTDVAALAGLTSAEGVVAHTGPFPVTGAELKIGDQPMDVQAIGRDETPASVDQPEVIQGGWVDDGGVVVEAAFAAAKNLDVGEQVNLNGRPFEIVGIAVTAASPIYPETTCYIACVFGAGTDELADLPHWVLRDPGLVWVTETKAQELVSQPDSMSYILNLQLDDPDVATEFVIAREPTGDIDSAVVPMGLRAWQEILEESSDQDAQIVFLIGSGLLIPLAMVTVAVLVGGRMADQSRRVGLLKAVGATPRLVAGVLLAEYVAVALLAAGVGLMLGWLLAPLVTEPGAGLLGAVAPSLSPSTVAIVTGTALVVAAIATFVPAVRAARTSTVVALDDQARQPRRSDTLIAISSRLPTSLLLGLRMLARRPRRLVLSILGIAIAVSGVVALVAGQAEINELTTSGGVQAERIEQLWQVLIMIMVMLAVLSAVNAVVICWATVLDTRQASAVARALGATPQQVSTGLAIAQILPGLVGALLGVPAGIGLFVAIEGDLSFLPPYWQFAAVVLVAVLAIALLTAIPARFGGRRAVVDILRSEHV